MQGWACHTGELSFTYEQGTGRAACVQVQAWHPLSNDGTTTLETPEGLTSLAVKNMHILIHASLAEEGDAGHAGF